jgi:tetratricopeptide (TPR) repeat protein
LPTAGALLSPDAALAIDPNAAQAWSNRGMLLRELRRFDEAATSFEWAIAAGGDAQLNAYYLASLGNFASRKGATPADALDLCFTVELASGQGAESTGNAGNTGSAADMQLQPTLRYAHSECLCAAS